MYWYNERQSQQSGVSPWQLSSALSVLAESKLLVPSSVGIDLEAVAKVLDYQEPTNRGGGPGSIHRVDWIFENPSFTVDGFDSTDVKQGYIGDCWFIAAVATICSNPTLMDKVCVARDEECGVYGFVFYRDGEWIGTVVDDNLYLKYEDFDATGDRYDPTSSKEKKYKKDKQTGSDALYFSACADQNETWLPLLEKAYAKVHGDYSSISGGNRQVSKCARWFIMLTLGSGEAVEDLTGGVTSKLLTNRILSKDRLWKELLEVRAVNPQLIVPCTNLPKGE